MVIKIYFDGSCNNHLKDPPAGVGVAVFINDKYSEEDSRAIGIMPHELGLRNTNNVAEWQACVQAMLVLESLMHFYPKAEYQIFSDSEVVSLVFNGINKTHTPEFVVYKNQAWKQMRKVGQDIKIQHILRKFNKQADKLAEEGVQLAKSK